MVNFPPLMPSATWMTNYTQGVLNGLSFEEAISVANISLESTRDFGRYIIHDPKGLPNTLSVAVEGGGRQLRCLDKVSELRLSEHGDWRRNHLKALEASLGRKPFFPYIYPELSGIYLNKELNSLKDFNSAIFNFLFTFILGNIKISDFQRFNENEILTFRGKEIANQICWDNSIIEAVATFGKESLLGFLTKD